MASKKKKSILASASSRTPMGTPPIQKSTEASTHETNGKLFSLTQAIRRCNHILTPNSDLPSRMITEAPAQNLTLVSAGGPVVAVWPLQGPIIEVEEEDGEKPRWGSDSSSESEAFMDDDMDFLPTGWRKNNNEGGEDEGRAQFARKGKLKKAKGQKTLTVENKPTAFPMLTKRTATVS